MQEKLHDEYRHSPYIAPCEYRLSRSLLTRTAAGSIVWPIYGRVVCPPAVCHYGSETRSPARSHRYPILAFQASFILIPIMSADKIRPCGCQSVDGWYQSIGGVSFAIFTPIWGALGDRWLPPVLIRATAATSLMLLLMAFARTPSQLLSPAIQGSVTGTPAAASALSPPVRPEPTGLRSGVQQTSLFIGTSLGPMFGGFIGDTYYRSTFFAPAPSFSSLLPGALYRTGTGRICRELCAGAQALRHRQL